MQSTSAWGTVAGYGWSLTKQEVSSNSPSWSINRSRIDSTADRIATLREEVRYQEIVDDGGKARDRERRVEKPTLNPLEAMVRRTGGAHRFELKDIWHDDIH